MTQNDKREVKLLVVETIKECNLSPQRMEFSKKLIIWALVFYALIGIACLVLWSVFGDWPHEIAIFFVSPIVGVVSYMVKSGYENKAKIQKCQCQKEV